MSIMKTTTRIIIVSLTVLFGISSANAALIDFTLNGDVDSADAGNIFNVTVDSTITATGSFDDSLLTGGTGAISNLSITVGALSFDDSMDVWGGGLITLTGSGSLSEFIYEADAGVNSSSAFFDSFFTSFTGSAFNGPKDKGSNTELTIAGTWDTSSFNVAVVPVPAAIWLFGSGLLGLAGMARRKSA